MLSSGLIIEIASFATNLVLLTLYFSQIISSRGWFHKNGLAISLVGMSVSAVFILLVPLLPESIPWMDIGIVFVVVIWLSLTKYLTQMSWLGSLAVASFGGLLYMIISVFVTAFVSGLLIIFGVMPPPFS